MGDFDALKLRSRKLKRQLVESVGSMERLQAAIDNGGTVALCDILGWEQAQVDTVNDALMDVGLPTIPHLDGTTVRERRAAERAERASQPVPAKGMCSTCGLRPSAKPKRRCYWCLLAAAPIEEQIAAADARAAQAVGEHRARVPAAEWPEGERWCSGCQAFIPLTYCSGSRCKAHASVASHRTRLQATYGISREDYERILAHQGGRCYICQRQVRSKRLAVDHDHRTGEVRGLLCADSERGCNHAILGNIRDIEMARRIVAYLEAPPAREALRPADAPPPLPFIYKPF